ncbi:putative F-box protein PP2-B12 isoform X2 [Rhodamnia argentea]|uniref:F-box protein PP2-B12 isoform X2 n=1 Tax=Rhodamnia argentea TaxID=178133 RepID=A0ABM3H9Q7_9MYRT|nr:putative F-box protein PP2-B12 isoform X2 [Rhodamnia argentea]
MRRRIETRTSDGASNAIDPKEMVELDALPEVCIAHILSFTTPRDAARSSAVSRTFRSASDSDAVWHKFLPPDLDLIISTSLPPPQLQPQPQPPLGPSLTRKKDVFLSLCSAPLLIDEGHKSFALEKWSGKKCYMIGTRDLSIVWGDTPCYWRRSSVHVSRFPEVVELLRVCWLEVHAKMEMRLLSANTYYAAYLIFKLVHRSYGFENQAVEVSIFSGSGGERRNICLDPGGKLRRQYQSARERYLHTFHDASAIREVQAREEQIPLDRGDGWKEVDLGEFFVDDPPAGEVQINLMEVKSGNWKSGLVIQGIDLRPSQMTSRERSLST